MYPIQSNNASKTNVTPKGVYLPISMLHSTLAVVNLLAHDYISQICYCGQISLQSAAVNCSFSDNLTSLGGNVYLLAMVHMGTTLDIGMSAVFVIIMHKQSA